jgi:hypothetical protein
MGSRSAGGVGGGGDRADGFAWWLMQTPQNHFYFLFLKHFPHQGNPYHSNTFRNRGNIESSNQGNLSHPITFRIGENDTWKPLRVR